MKPSVSTAKKYHIWITSACSQFHVLLVRTKFAMLINFLIDPRIVAWKISFYNKIPNTKTKYRFIYCQGQAVNFDGKLKFHEVPSSSQSAHMVVS